MLSWDFIRVFINAGRFTRDGSPIKWTNGMVNLVFHGVAVVPDKAQVIEKEQDKFIKYQWLHSEKNEYFEFRIEKTEISNQTVLIIKDFAEKNEIKDQSQLWEYQVKELFHRLGA